VALGLPWVSVGGESALRLDVPAGRLHAFGASFAIDEAFVVLAATLVVTAAFLLVTLLFGRVWCGWACPQTVLADLTSWVEPERREKPRRPPGGPQQ
jgi:polyferredoxin